MVGNLKNFTKIDILRCLLKIDKPVSRSRLSEILDLGEGTIRSILDILKNKDFLESDKKGHFLSSNKNSVVKKIKDNIIIKKVDLKLFPGKKIAVQIKSPEKVDKAHVLRDIAVKNGAEGAVILKYNKNEGKLKIFDTECEEDFGEIETKFSLSNEDLLIIAYAGSYRLAEHGALAVAVELDRDLKRLMDLFE